MEVLTITAPETFNFQAVMAVSMGWHVLAVWNTEPVSVCATFMLQRCVTDCHGFRCFSACGLESCSRIPPNESGYRSPVTRSMFSIKQSDGIFTNEGLQQPVGRFGIIYNLVIFYCAEIGLTCRICSYLSWS